MTLSISRSIVQLIAAQAAVDPALEVCGLLFGTDDAIETAVACRNVAEDPATRFEIDPAALLAAYRTQRSGGPRIVGCYHSHPSGAAHPSACDAAMADPNGWIWLIAGGADLAAFRATDDGAIHGRFDAVDYVVD